MSQTDLRLHYILTTISHTTWDCITSLTPDRRLRRSEKSTLECRNETGRGPNGYLWNLGRAACHTMRWTACFSNTPLRILRSFNNTIKKCHNYWILKIYCIVISLSAYVYRMLPPGNSKRFCALTLRLLMSYIYIYIWSS